jgi:hypothetical protein
MRFRSLALFALVVMTAPALPARAEEKAAPTLVVRIKSLDGLISDARYLAEAAGKGEEAKQVEAMIKGLAGPKGQIEGFDTTKPLAVYGRLAVKFEESQLVLMVPISDEKPLLDALKRLDITVEKKDDIYKVDLPFPVPFQPASVYFRFTDGYAYITVRDGKMLAKERLLAPAAVFAGHTGALEVTLDLDQVPEKIKEVIIGQVARRIGEAKGDKKPFEPEAAHAFRIAAADELANQIKAVVTDGKELRLKVELDRKNAEGVVSIRFIAKPGTKLAASLGEVGQEKSILANLGSADSAASGRVFASMPQGLRKPFDKFTDAMMTLAREHAPDDTARDLMDKIFKATRPTLRAAELDAGFDLRGPRASGHYTLVAGVAIKEGAEIEKALRALHAAAPAEARDFITLDAEKAGSINIHRVSVPADKIDREVKRILGDGPAYFAVRKDAVLMAAGDKALDSIKEVLARDPKAGKLIQLESSVARLAPLEPKGDAAALAKKVFGKDAGDDKVRVTLSAGNALELRLSAKAKVLGFIVQIEEARKNRGE